MNSDQAAMNEALNMAIIEHLGPEALAGGKMSVLDAFEKGWKAAISQQAAAEPVAFVNGDELDDLLGDRVAVISGVRDGWRKTALYRGAPPVQAQVQQIKDHVIAQTVNELRDIAIKFHGTQQLRQRIAYAIVPLLQGAPVQPVQQEAQDHIADAGKMVHWKLVPSTPTPEWIANLERSKGDLDATEIPRGVVEECIRELLAVAPLPVPQETRRLSKSKT